MLGPCAERHERGAGDTGYLVLHAHQLNLHLLASTLDNITELVRDSVISPPVPMHVTVTNSDITLKVCMLVHVT